MSYVLYQLQRTKKNVLYSSIAPVRNPFGTIWPLRQKPLVSVVSRTSTRGYRYHLEQQGARSEQQQGATTSWFESIKLIRLFNKTYSYPSIGVDTSFSDWLGPGCKRKLGVCANPRQNGLRCPVLFRVRCW